MDLKEFNIILDIKRQVQHEEIEVVQGDFESNIFNIQLINGLNEYSLEGTTVEVAFAKSDGTTVLQDMENGIVFLDDKKGKLQCVLKTNTIASPGKVLAEVRVLGYGENLLTSARFSFFVRKSIVNDETVESTDEFPALIKMLREVNEAVQEVNDLIEEIQGKPELKGDKGDSAYQVWLSEGNEGAIDDYLISLIGPPGPEGPQGEEGERGPSGSIENLDKGNIEDALGYTPADEIDLESKVSKSGDTMTDSLIMNDSNIYVDFPIGDSIKGLRFRDINKIENFMIGAYYLGGEFNKGYIGKAFNNNHLEFYDEYSIARKPFREYLTSHTVSSQVEFDNYMDTLDNDINEFTKYTLRVGLCVVITNPMNTGGSWIIEGYKHSNLFAWQRITSYSGPNNIFFRVKTNGTWEPWQTIATDKEVPWINAILQNGWVTESVVSYRKNALGRLEFKGAMRDGLTTTGTVLFTLPLQYRPISSQTIVAQTYQSSTSGANIFFIVINANNGEVFINRDLAVGKYISLSNISVVLD